MKAANLTVMEECPESCQHTALRTAKPCVMLRLAEATLRKVFVQIEQEKKRRGKESTVGTSNLDFSAAVYCLFLAINGRIRIRKKRDEIAAR